MDFKDRIAGKIVGAVGLRLSMYMGNLGWFVEGLETTLSGRTVSIE